MVVFVVYVLLMTKMLLKQQNFHLTILRISWQNMQWALDTWGGMIRATGGALIPEKMFWYAINFEWRDGEWNYAFIADLASTLRMQDTQNRVHNIETVELEVAL